MLRTCITTLLACSTLTPLCSADEVRWINAAGGAFSDGANWDVGHPPAPTDTIILDIPGAYTITFETSQKATDLVAYAGAVTLDLSGKEFTSNVTSRGGMLWVTNGSVAGSAYAAGGRLTVEPSATFNRGGGASVDGSNAGAIVVRGTVGKSGDGFGGFSVGAGALLRLEGGAISTRAFSVLGQAEIIGGSIQAETVNIMGALDMNGGTIDGEFGQDFWQGSTSRIYNGATVTSGGDAAVLAGTVLVEGPGTRLRIHRITGAVTVQDGGAIYKEQGEFSITQNGRLVLGRGGSAEGRFYRMDNGVLRLEAGANPVNGFEGFSMFPNVGLEIVLDGTSPSAPSHFYSYFTELSGTLRLEFANGYGLAVGEELPLLTADGPTITGSFRSIVVPSLPGHRTLDVEIRSSEVLAHVIAGGDQPCWGADFNGDGDGATDADIEAFFACLAGQCCPTCGGPDFNSDGDLGTDADIEAFFRVLAGNPC